MYRSIKASEDRADDRANPAWSLAEWLYHRQRDPDRDMPLGGADPDTRAHWLAVATAALEWGGAKEIAKSRPVEPPAWCACPSPRPGAGSVCMGCGVRMELGRAGDGCTVCRHPKHEHIHGLNGGCDKGDCDCAAWSDPADFAPVPESVPLADLRAALGLGDYTTAEDLLGEVRRVVERVRFADAACEVAGRQAAGARRDLLAEVARVIESVRADGTSPYAVVFHERLVNRLSATFRPDGWPDADAWPTSPPVPSAGEGVGGQVDQLEEGRHHLRETIRRLRVSGFIVDQKVADYLEHLEQGGLPSQGRHLLAGIDESTRLVPPPTTQPAPGATCGAVEPGTGRLCIGDPPRPLKDWNCAVGVHSAWLAGTDVWFTPPHPEATHGLDGRALDDKETDHATSATAHHEALDLAPGAGINLADRTRTPADGGAPAGKAAQAVAPGRALGEGGGDVCITCKGARSLPGTVIGGGHPLECWNCGGTGQSPTAVALATAPPSPPAAPGGDEPEDCPATFTTADGQRLGCLTASGHAGQHVTTRAITEHHTWDDLRGSEWGACEMDRLRTEITTLRATVAEGERALASLRREANAHGVEVFQRLELELARALCMEVDTRWDDLIPEVGRVIAQANTIAAAYAREQAKHGQEAADLRADLAVALRAARGESPAPTPLTPSDLATLTRLLDAELVRWAGASTAAKRDEIEAVRTRLMAMVTP